MLNDYLTGTLVLKRVRHEKMDGNGGSLFYFLIAMQGIMTNIMFFRDCIIDISNYLYRLVSL